MLHSIYVYLNILPAGDKNRDGYTSKSNSLLSDTRNTDFSFSAYVSYATLP